MEKQLVPESFPAELKQGCGVEEILDENES
jgi:hypothetical protein